MIMTPDFNRSAVTIVAVLTCFTLLTVFYGTQVSNDARGIWGLDVFLREIMVVLYAAI